MNYVVCYCRNIYLKDVIKAVFSIDEPTKENIIKFLVLIQFTYIIRKI